MFFWKKKEKKEEKNKKIVNDDFNSNDDLLIEEENYDEILEIDSVILKENDLLENEESKVVKKVNTKKTSNKKSSTKKTNASKKPPSKKTSSSKSNVDSKRNIYYVSPRKDNKGKKLGWEVKIKGAKKVTAFFKSKEEAIKKVRQLASNKKGTTIIVKKIDGSHHETIKI